MTTIHHGGHVRGKRRMMSAAALAAVAVALVAWLVPVSPGTAELRGSKHDFTNTEWSGGSACAACHVPHRADQPKTPKWGGPTTIRRDPPADRGRPGPLSRKCLSCHDGSTATDTFGEETVGLNMPARSRVAANGDLRNDHPIGVRYPTGQRDYQPLSRVERGERVRLFNGRVECSSCHNPHDKYDQPHMLVMPNDESQLCSSCHRV